MPIHSSGIHRRRVSPGQPPLPTVCAFSISTYHVLKPRTERAREDELLYVLRKLGELRLWSGSLWAALAEDPSAYCVTQPRECFSLFIIESLLLTQTQWDA